MRLLLIAIACTVASAAHGQQRPDIFPREPPPGALRPGQVIYVDNGRCPRGQILEVRGADRMGPGQRRSRRCVPRPR